METPEPDLIGATVCKHASLRYLSYLETAMKGILNTQV
jgi:hypothetical protein